MVVIFFACHICNIMLHNRGAVVFVGKAAGMFPPPTPPALHQRYNNPVHDRHEHDISHLIYLEPLHELNKRQAG